AMGRLARHLVDSAAPDGLRVVAITGSSGKTSTKDLLAQILEQVGPTVAPYGNLNNEIGVPLTASRIDADTAFLVVEMGARGVGQVAYLCELTPPRVGVVLNVGQAHVGEFGSQQAIARAKGELVEALDANGVAVLNADDELVRGMRERSEAAVLAFSAHAEPAWPRAVWAEGLASDELGRYRFVLRTKSAEESPAEAPVELRLSGRHHVANAVAAAAAASALGVDLGLIAGSLSNAQLRSSSRMEIHERADDVIVINDAYNANPDSARAAVDALAEMGRARRARQDSATTWAILGDMLELGESSAQAHAALGRYAVEAGIDRLIAVGEFAPALAAGAFAAGAADSAVLVTDKPAAAQQVIPNLKPGDIVLVKASRGLALDTVAEEIWTAPEGHQTAKSEDLA
nr:UDP-N-acetylmuramoyl-tripeptide--D-alanyl-D-alanine ligase [Propionibacteriaceae bacterium]